MKKKKKKMKNKKKNKKEIIIIKIRGAGTEPLLDIVPLIFSLKILLYVCVLVLAILFYKITFYSS